MHEDTSPTPWHWTKFFFLMLSRSSLAYLRRVFAPWAWAMICFRSESFRFSRIKSCWPNQNNNNKKDIPMCVLRMWASAAAGHTVPERHISPVNSHGVLQSASLSVPSAAPLLSHPSSELCCAGHWSHLRSLLTLKTASHPNIQSTGNTNTLFATFMYIHCEKWLLNFCAAEVHLVALLSVKGHTFCFFDGFTHQGVATDKVHSLSQLVCTHSSINLHNIH